MEGVFWDTVQLTFSQNFAHVIPENHIKISYAFYSCNKSTMII